MADWIDVIVLVCTPVASNAREPGYACCELSALMMSCMYYGALDLVWLGVVYVFVRFSS